MSGRQVGAPEDLVVDLSLGASVSAAAEDVDILNAEQRHAADGEQYIGLWLRHGRRKPEPGVTARLVYPHGCRTVGHPAAGALESDVNSDLLDEGIPCNPYDQR